MSCPWAKIAAPEPVNLDDIMSEEMAKDLQEKENKKVAEQMQVKEATWVEPPHEGAQMTEGIPEDLLAALAEDGCQSDAEIARQLQLQFDKEHDEMLKRTEQKYNGTSKVSLSLSNYRRVPEYYEEESETEEEIVDIRDRKDWDRFDTLKREMNSIPACGYKVNKDGTVTTKHDIEMNGRKNACKILSFPPEFHTGDGEDFDMKLSNKVFNKLKIHSKHEQARRHRIQDKKEDSAIAALGFDEATSLILLKWVENQMLEPGVGVISSGKEAIILYTTSDPSFTKFKLPKECVIKVFKTTLTEFKRREEYIKDDHRFGSRIGKQSLRDTIPIWVEKEFSNLSRMDQAGINCPTVVEHRKNCLVLSFIGVDARPAPKLKHAVLSEAEWIGAYEEIVKAMKTLYDKANLIHADLSEYNILWHQEKCYFIDVSQSVEPTHDNAFHFLMRDCRNITKFFDRKEIPGVMPDKELFKTITGFDYDDTASMEKTAKIKPHLVDRPDFEPPPSYKASWETVPKKKSASSCKRSTKISNKTSPLVEPPST